MTFSTLTIADVKNYLRLVETTASEDALLTSILDSAKHYVLKYTGLSESLANDEPDLVIAVYVLCQDAWDNRAYYVDSNNVNKVVDSILGMHSVNLL